MSKEIEADGFVTRQSDLSSIKHVCANCKWWVFEPIDRGHVCCNGHSIHVADWRQKYDCCDLWEHK